MKRSRTGFTLMELIVVSATMGIIALALYSTLSGGIRIWKRLDHQRKNDGVGIFFEKFTSDLRNGIRHSAVKFSGGPDGFEAPTIVASRKLNSRTVGRVKYSYFADKKVIKRYAADYSDIYNGADGTAQDALAGVKSFKLTYYTLKAESGEYVWLDEWTEAGMPLAVRIELETGDDDRINRFARTVGIPAGG